MTKLAALAAPVLLFLHWLAVGHVTATVAGASFSVPVLLVVAVIIASISALLVVLVVLRAQAEQAPPWQQRGRHAA
jgi:hypothetical protein